MDQDALIALIVADSSIGDYLEYADISECTDDAMADTGWSFPLSGTFQEYWAKQRAKRHCFFRLWTVSARKFKVEQINLGDRFSHYGAVIALMDEQFVAAMEDNPAEFTSVETYKMFGTIARPGTRYDIAGNDITDYTEVIDE